MIAGYSGLYEILLIILVAILIYNGLIKGRVLSKINDNLEHDNRKTSASKEGEYVDYEIVEENNQDEQNKLD
ncbi:hypothetical protein [Parvicella tangerina]|uniref:Uncharacterized protein n=1 Tax=Parvicella tangerina TaxID=2829795 RepID=A0A916JNT2_9FLAO|nr:hypothetical protein [Parvicella tangerina]CAG5084560.1 hypothetical protein CRYO30217_02499 [Parvicella tangerina]